MTCPSSATTTPKATASSSSTTSGSPQDNILAGEGTGFPIAQARLGPGRIHHCMRAIGAAERALELMCERADEREAFGHPISHYANIRDWIAESRIELEMARLLVMKTAWLMDTVGNRHARIEISGIKFAVPNICLRILDRAIQVHGGGGVSDDFPLASMYADLRTLRLADGPDEVHKLSLARHELRASASAGRYTGRPRPVDRETSAEPALLNGVATPASPPRTIHVTRASPSRRARTRHGP